MSAQTLKRTRATPPPAPWRPQGGPAEAETAARDAPKQPQDAAPGQTKDWGNSTTPLSNKNRRVDALAPAKGDNKAAD